MPETTDNYHHIPVRPKGDFDPDSFRTITVSKAQGIKAVIGKVKRGKGKGAFHIQKYMFDVEKWTMAEAKAWVKKHKRDRNRRDLITRSAMRDESVWTIEGRTVTGYAAVFDQETEIHSFLGSFREVLRPGAFTKTLRNNDVVALWNHNADYPLGRVTNGTLQIEEDDYGLRTSVTLPDTTVGNDAFRLIQRGDVDAMSFRFRIVESDWHEAQREDELPLNEIREVDLVEVSFVAFPAYAGSIIVSARDESTAEDVANDMVEDVAEGIAGGMAEGIAGDMAEGVRGAMGIDGPAAALGKRLNDLEKCYRYTLHITTEVENMDKLLRKLDTLNAERRKLLDEAKALTQKAIEEAEGKLSDEQQKTFDAKLARAEELADEVKAIQETLEKADKIRKMDQALDKPTRTPAMPKPESRITEQREEAWPGPAPFGKFLQAVARAGADVSPAADAEVARLYRYNEELVRAASGMSVTIPSDGGFLVAPTYRDELLQIAQRTGVVYPKCTTIPVTTGSVKIPAVDEATRATGATSGGILMYWKAEAEEKEASKPKIRQITLEPEELSGLIYVTDRLLKDAPAIEAYLMQMFPKQLNFKLDDAVINGTGAGQPLGILNSGATVTVSKEAGQAANTIVTENIVKMFARMHPESMRNAIWLINQDCIPQIYTLSLAVGTGGGPMFIAPGALPNQPQATLLGRPIEVIEQCQTVGTAGDIILADLSQYLFATSGAMTSESSIHVRFIYNETAYRFVFYADGQPWWSNALTPYKGSSTVSPFVILETRS